MRAAYGLSAWLADSVAVTTDAAVCRRIDSRILAWFTTPTGAASGALRNETWGPRLDMVRLNPGRDYVWPGVGDGEGWAYNFIVDSVSGNVACYETPFGRNGTRRASPRWHPTPAVPVAISEPGTIAIGRSGESNDRVVEREPGSQAAVSSRVSVRRQFDVAYSE